jgi:tetratricopeptide (TPR) repeat protein
MAGNYALFDVGFAVLKGQRLSIYPIVGLGCDATLAQCEETRGLRRFLGLLMVEELLAQCWRYAGKQDDAERELRVALREDSTSALGRFYLGRVHQARGRLDSAVAEYRATGPLRDWVPTIAAVGHVYGSQEHRREARATLARLDPLSRQTYVTAYAVALVERIATRLKLPM